MNQIKQYVQSMTIQQEDLFHGTLCLWWVRWREKWQLNVQCWSVEKKGGKIGIDCVISYKKQERTRIRDIVPESSCMIILADGQQ